MILNLKEFSQFLEVQKVFKIIMGTNFYQYTVLPNGFAPTVQKLTKKEYLPFKLLRSQGHLSVKYLDDSLLLGETALT